MKVLFAGPSLAGVDLSHISTNVVLRGPAQQGDVTRAVIGGATAIGLVDGLFEAVAAVWHKEILFGLSEGVRIFGAGSMGALRAAECAPFGMMGIGAVYRRYASGELDDDAAVAQVHAPAELGYTPLSEALVNVEATVANAERRGLINAREARGLRHEAERIFFKDRTWDRIIEIMPGITTSRRTGLRSAVSEASIDVKRQDAEDLLIHLDGLPNERQPPPGFVLSRTHLLEETIRSLSGARTVG